MAHSAPDILLKMKIESPFNIYDLGEIRKVLSGGEYDNVYSNDLAKQRAEYELWLHTRLNDGLTLSCVPIYWADVNMKINRPSVHLNKGNDILYNPSDGTYMVSKYQTIENGSSSYKSLGYSVGKDKTEFIIKSISFDLSIEGTMNISAIKFYHEDRYKGSRYTLHISYI